MARATNPGAPQRVSAHVVPKAPSFSSDDEEEKTTIESGGWEEEASTTVEQGDVADKLRALAIGAAQPARSNTAITTTTGSGVSDEPTVDDQRASAALALRPPPGGARLVITGGNDAGRQLEVRPGKTYMIGRGIDNDLVLTDITASRKHFDIRHENGAWILADRASGNGTLINSRIEDAPFMLASGDTIEVGHTAFRFEVVTTAISLPGLPREAPGGGREAPAGSARDARAAEAPTVEDPSDSRELMATPAVHAAKVSRELLTPAVLREAAASAAREAAELRDAGGERARGGVPDEMPSFDGSVDDDLELSTVSGKPMQDPEAPTPHVAASRPKTLPPPAPLPRPRTQTGRPPLAFAATRSQQMAVAQPTQPPFPPVALAAAMAPTISPMHAVPALPQPATTLPLPQMANRPPLAPGLLDSSLGAQLAPTSLPATLPGQGRPLPPNRALRLPFSYPAAPALAAQRSSGIIRAPVSVAAAHPGRDATSTALVHPMSYSGGQAVAAQPPPQRRMPAPSRRMMLALGLVAIAVFAAIATVAIIRSAAGPSNSSGHGGAPAAPAPAARPPTVTPIPSAAAPSPGSAAARPATDKGGAAPPASSPAHSPSSARVASPPAPPADPAGSPPSPRASGDKIAVASPIASAPSPAPATAAPTGSSPSVAVARPAPGPAPAAAASPAPARGSADPSASPPGPSAPPPAGAAPAVPSSGAAGSVASDRVAASGPGAGAPSAPPARVAAPSPAARVPEPAHPAPGDKTRADAAPARPARPVKHAEPRRPEHKVEVAVAPRPEKRRAGRSLQDVKSEATGLYRSKNFSGAALAINSALSGFSGDDVKDLKAIAAIYSQLGKAYAVGMAPGTKPVDAYQALLRANDYDREVGGAYARDLHDKLVAIAPRAATSYMAAKSFEQALQAVRKAEELGSRTDDLKIVRQNLEEKARELLRVARGELASDPDAARQKLHQIQGIVDRQNPLWQQAARLLNGP